MLFNVSPGQTFIPKTHHAASIQSNHSFPLHSNHKDEVTLNIIFPTTATL